MTAKGGKAWTSEMQEELDEITLFLVDVDEVIDTKKTEISSEIYKVPAGEEKLVHAQVIHGRRFNPNTGKEESHPFVQSFTYGEWQLFKKNHALLGYIIVKELHNPYNK